MTARGEVINLARKFDAFDDLWSPKVVAEVNDYQVKLARLQGEFVWHRHEDTDEMFLCLTGSLTIHVEDEAVALGPGDLYVVPKGVGHKPVSEGGCQVLLIEPRGVINTGDAENGHLTAPRDDWI